MTSLSNDWNATKSAGMVKTLRPLNEASHAPGDFYTNTELLEVERKTLFKKEWLFVGRQEQYSEPGSYKSFKIAGEPIVICRDRSGVLRAFYNACLHRGVEVVEGEGVKLRFMCPYHGWSYTLDGRLAAAQYMENAEEFDIQSCRLNEIRMETWEGCIFINLNDEAEGLDAFLEDFARDLSVVGMGQLRLGATYEFEFPANWKLGVENFADLYHVGVLHKASIGKNFNGSAVEWKERGNGGYFVTYDAGPALGEPIFGKIRAMAELPDSWSATTYLSPNLQVFVRTDAIRMVTTWPVTVDTMRVVQHDLFPADAIDRPDYAERIAMHKEMITRTLEEDRSMIASLQRVQSSERWSPGRMASLEGLVHRIIGHLAEKSGAVSASGKLG